jgi:hypothetical protein
VLMIGAYWVVAPLAAAVLAPRARREAAVAERLRCLSCGYPCGAGVCPECGPVRTAWPVLRRLGRMLLVRMAAGAAVVVMMVLIAGLVIAAVNTEANRTVRLTWNAWTQKWPLRLVGSLPLLNSSSAPLLVSPHNRVLLFALSDGAEVAVSLRGLANGNQPGLAPFGGGGNANGLIFAIMYRPSSQAPWQREVELRDFSAVATGQIVDSTFVYRLFGGRLKSQFAGGEQHSSGSSFQIGPLGNGFHFMVIVMDGQPVAAECVTGELQPVAAELEAAIAAKLSGTTFRVVRP